MSVIYQCFNVQLRDLLKKLHSNFPENDKLHRYLDAVNLEKPSSPFFTNKIKTEYISFNQNFQGSLNVMVDMKDTKIFGFQFLVDIDFENMYMSTTPEGKDAMFAVLKPLIEYITILDVVGDSIGHIGSVVEKITSSGNRIQPNSKRITESVRKYMTERPKEMDRLASSLESENAFKKVEENFPDLAESLKLMSSMV
jgi:hypothetical protein